MSLPIWWNEIKRKYFIKQIKLNFDNMKYIVFNFFSIILIFTSCEKEELEQINILIELAKKGDNIIWNHLTDSTAQVSFSDCGITVSATCFFDKSGCIKKLISFDRYRAIDNDVVKTKWTTLFYNYKQLNGYNIPTSIEYIWNLENKDFVYATIDIIDVNYDEFNTY